MGTNYYRVNIPTEDDIKEMHRLIDEKKFNSERGWWKDGVGIIPDDAVTCVQDIIDNCTKKVHICKMSYGWQTCFDHNWGKYYQPNRKSLEAFLKEPNTVIRDEYGEDISYEEFWKLVNQRDNITYSDGRKPWNSDEYQKYRVSRGESREYLCLEDIQKCKEKFGVKIVNSNDFEVDGLRFAVYSDFS